MSSKSKPIPMAGSGISEKGDAGNLGVKSENSYGLKSEMEPYSFDDGVVHSMGMTASGNLGIESLGSFGDDAFGMSFGLSGSADLSRRSRTGSIGAGRSSISTSISGRLNLVSDLEQQGVINKDQKGNMKDMIINRDPELLTAMERYEQGQPQALQQMIDQNKLQSTEDIADGLDLAMLHVGSLDDGDDGLYQNFDFPEMTFSMDDETFAGDDDFNAGSLTASVPSHGLGMDSGTMFSDIGQVDENQGHSQKGPQEGVPLPPQTNNKDVVKQETIEPKINTTPTVKTETGIMPPPPQLGKGKQPGSSSSSSSAPICINANNTTSRVTNTSTRDQNDVVHTEGRKKIGAYSPNSRKARIDRFLEKRNNRVWTKKVKYDVRKNFADSRLRVKGRFVKKEDEELLRELLKIT